MFYHFQHNLPWVLCTCSHIDGRDIPARCGSLHNDLPDKVRRLIRRSTALRSDQLDHDHHGSVKETCEVIEPSQRQPDKIVTRTVILVSCASRSQWVRVRERRVCTLLSQHTRKLLVFLSHRISTAPRRWQLYRYIYLSLSLSLCLSSKITQKLTVAAPGLANREALGWPF